MDGNNRDEYGICQPANSIVRTHSPMQARTSATFSFDPKECFNPAQIPHNFMDSASEQSTRQIPIEEVLATMQKSEINDPLLDTYQDEQHYEHQAIEENEDILEASPQEALLPHKIETSTQGETSQSQSDSQNEAIVIDKLDNFHTTESAANLSIFLDHTTDSQLPSSPSTEPESTRDHEEEPSRDNEEETGVRLLEETALPLEPFFADGDDPIFDDFNDMSEIASTTDKAHSPNTNIPRVAMMNNDTTTIQIPDDLDEAEFNIDDELDADFAAMEASFSQNLYIQSTDLEDKSVTSVSRDTVNPYLPTSSTSTPLTNSGHYFSNTARGPQSLTSPTETSSSLFTPADVQYSKSNKTTGNQYTNYSVTARIPVDSTGSSTSLGPLQTQGRQTSASFVNAKAAYTDPYALPDVLVAKKRSRPQTQTLRAAASVPNFKVTNQTRPPIGQRHVSTMNASSNAASQQIPPNARPYTSQSTYGPSDTQSDVRSASVNPVPIAEKQLYPSNAAPTLSPPRNTTYTQNKRSQNYLGVPNAALPPTQQPPNHISRQLSYNKYAPVPLEDQPRQPSTEPMNNPVYHTGQSRYPGTNHAHSFPAAIRSHSPLNENRAGSIDAIMKGRPSPLQSQFVITPQSEVHQRHESNTSVHSYDSSAPQEAAYGDFLDHQRDAESRMFGDTFAVAEDEIYAAQSLQRGPGTYSPIPFSSSQSVNRTNTIRPQSQPRSVTSTFSNGGIVPDGSRRSLDERHVTSALEMSRSLSKGTERNAVTEPSHSPQHSHIMLNAQLGGMHNRTQHRPPIASRATSSGHAYQQFPRGSSPALPIHVAPADAQNSASTDPLVGHPVARFGFGGMLLTTLPKRIPRFSPQGTMQHQIAGPGPVILRPSQEFLETDILGDFPGPLMHTKVAIKQKKADLQLWLAKRISPGNTQNQDDKTLLYRLLMLLLEFDGSLESNVAKERLITLLYPDMAHLKADDGLSNFKLATSIIDRPNMEEGLVLKTSTLTDSAVNRLSELLLCGDKQGALRFASESKLWAHALLIASRVSQQCWAEVVHEFAATELQTDTEASESLKFVYQSFAGISTDTVSSTLQTNDYAIQNWRRCLTMILKNRATNDDLAIISLGRSLLEHNKTFAAHCCFLLCSQAKIGPKDDPMALLTMVGQQDILSPCTTERNEAILMSEIYEFSLSLAQPKFLGLPHLLAFKLQRAHFLSDAGHTTVSRKYCEAITSALKALPKGSQHLHHVLIEQLRDFVERIDQVSAETTSSWIGSKIAKPKMDNIWGSLEGKFSKFVAGDNEDNRAAHINAQGPFAKLAQTPALSRVQSFVDVKGRAQHQSAPYNGGYEGEALQPSASRSHVDGNSYPYPEGDTNFSQPIQTNTAWQTPSYPGTSIPSIDQPSVSQDTTRLRQASNTYLPQPNYSAVQRPGTGLSSPYANSNPGQVYSPQVSTSYLPSPSTLPSISQADLTNQTQFVNPMAHLYQEPLQSVSGNTADNAAQYHAERTNPIEQQSVHMQFDQASQALSVGEDTNLIKESPIPPSSDNQDSIVAQETTKANAKTSQAEEKKAGWLGGWFGGKKKEPVPATNGDVKVHKAKLGEGMSLVYDPVTKKWTNPKGTMPEESKSSAPPPPMMGKRAAPPAKADSPAPAAAGATPGFQSNGLSNPLPSSGQGPSISGPGTAAGTIPRELPPPEDDLAAMLSAGPAPRRAASGTMGPPAIGAGSTRAKKSKPAKRYVDVFQEET